MAMLHVNNMIHYAQVRDDETIDAIQCLCLELNEMEARMWGEHTPYPRHRIAMAALIVELDAERATAAKRALVGAA